MFDDKYELDILVNTVNCIGVMGKGIALEFKRRFPKYYIDYKELCNAHIIRPGGIYLHNITKPWIISFATKDHWKNPSELQWISDGLRKLSILLDTLKNGNQVVSIGVPALGCGNGGLDWQEVKPLIVKELGDITNRVVVFEPLEKKYEQSIHKVQGTIRTVRRVSTNRTRQIS